MSEVTVDSQVVTPPVPVAPQEPPKPVVQASALPEDALKARLEAAKAAGKNDLLKELGVTDPAQLKAALDAIKAADEARKTEAEKFAELASKEQQARARLAEYELAITSVRDAEFANLTQEQLAAINAIAGDNPAAQVRALNALRPTWGAKVAPVAAPVVTPATTAPSASAPPSQSVSPIDYKAQFEELNKINPVKAARFKVANEREFLK